MRARTGAGGGAVILLAGIPSEPPVALAAHAAQMLGIACVMLNQRAFAFDDLDVQAADGACAGTLTVGGQRYRLDDFTGIYLRTIDAGALPGVGQAGALAARAVAWSETLAAWTDIAPQRVVNRPSATLSNFSKPLQARLIRDGGFAIAETLVTNDPAAVRAFLRRHGQVVYKSISSVRSIVRRLDGPALARLEGIRGLPTQFQRHVRGEDVRIHVVDGAVFAARIVSDAVDYRYAAADGLDVAMHAFVPPADICARCVALARALALPFCGIDFKVTADGTYVCLEVNPSPAYSYYERQTGAPIAAALVRYLAGG